MIRRTLLVCATLVLPLGIAATSAVALDTPSSQRAAECREQIDAMYGEISDRLHGVERLRDPLAGTLGTGQKNSAQLKLQGGSQYFFGGACDTGCSNLDLILRDSSGQVVAADQENDDVPIIDFVVDADGTFTLEAQMLACSQPPCHYQVGSFFQENPWLSLCHQQIDQVAAALAEDYPSLRRVGEPIPGSLDNGKSTIETIDLRAADYLILGVCDGDCSDLNLVAKDQNGKILDSDLEDDDYPVLAIESSGATQIDVVVDMAACATSPCFYGIGVFTF